VIEEATRNLVQLRDGWIKARPDRTLTGLYNEQPTWLQHANEKLDEAVKAAYGWEDDPGEEEVLLRLLDLNSMRSGAPAHAR
jgi:hypothetical protein